MLGAAGPRSPSAAEPRRASRTRTCRSGPDQPSSKALWRISAASGPASAPSVPALACPSRPFMERVRCAVLAGGVVGPGLQPLRGERVPGAGEGAPGAEERVETSPTTRSCEVLKSDPAAPPRTGRRTRAPARRRRWSRPRRPRPRPGCRRRDDDAVLAQPGVGPQVRRDGDPALLVRRLVGGAGQEHPLVVAGPLAGDRRLPDALEQPGELGVREDVEAALLARGDHEPARQPLAELGRQEQPALVVQPRWWVPRNGGADGAWWMGRSSSPGCATSTHLPTPECRPVPHCAPQYSTSLHRQPIRPRFLPGAPISPVRPSPTPPKGGQPAVHRSGRAVGALTLHFGHGCAGPGRGGGARLDGRRDGSGPGRSGPDPRLRAVAVVALLCVTASPCGPGRGWTGGAAGRADRGALGPGVLGTVLCSC